MKVRRNKPSVSTEILRYYEYYNMQETFDWLYQKSKNNQMKGIDLYKIITSENNILLAYRILKKNAGSRTEGNDGLTIDDFKSMKQEEFLKTIQNEFENYRPKSVRRVEIPKSNGKTRPLGIPSLKDRLIQQAVRQVLEPICEPKFYNRSYGFRANRSTQHALSRCMTLTNVSQCQYVVDVDIKGFFDNVNHRRLIK